jgi:L-2-hydroxyglutarate oxidase
LELKKEAYKNTDFSLSDTIDWLTYRGFLTFILKNTSFAMREFLSSLSTRAFIAKAGKLIPDFEKHMLIKVGSAVVRAHAVILKCELIMDFNVNKNNQIHVLNASSLVAMASLSRTKLIINNYKKDTI